jgi:DNA-binding response OmpR family regulator
MMTASETTWGDTQAVRVVLAEDDPGVVQIVAEALAAIGLSMTSVTDGREALAAVRSGSADLLLLDLGLPGLDGTDVLALLRRDSRLPVIVLSGRASERDRVLGLELGADDYLVKPFSVNELRARVQSVMRRALAPAAPRSRLEFGALTIDVTSRTVSVAGRPEALTRLEFDLLLHLATEPGKVFGRDELLTAVWHSSAAWQNSRTVTEHVRRLRQKLVTPDGRTWISTVHSVGYRFDSEPA